jgi:hypothetical protein
LAALRLCANSTKKRATLPKMQVASNAKIRERFERGDRQQKEPQKAMNPVKGVNYLRREPGRIHVEFTPETRK